MMIVGVLSIFLIARMQWRLRRWWWCFCNLHREFEQNPCNGFGCFPSRASGVKWDQSLRCRPVRQGPNLSWVNGYVRHSKTRWCAPFSASLALAVIRAGANGQTSDRHRQYFAPCKCGCRCQCHFYALDLSIGNRIDASSLDGRSSLASAGRLGSSPLWVSSYIPGYTRRKATASCRYAPTLPWNIRRFADSNELGVAGIRRFVDLSRHIQGHARGDGEKLFSWTAHGLRLSIRRSQEMAWFENSIRSHWSTVLCGRPASSGRARETDILPLSFRWRGDARSWLILPDAGRLWWDRSRFDGRTDWRDRLRPDSKPGWFWRFQKFTIQNDTLLELGNNSSRDVADYSAIDGTKDLFSSLPRFTLQVFGDRKREIKAASVTLFALDDAHPETWTNPNESGYGSFIAVPISRINRQTPDSWAWDRNSA